LQGLRLCVLCASAVNRGFRDSLYIDYAGMTHDPDNPCRFWGLSRVADSPCTAGTGVDRWETWVFRVDAPNCTPYPDHDDDREIGVADLVMFQQSFAEGSPRADLDDDGALTVFDWLLMVTPD
jgi:hypothetical protein